MRVNVQRFLLSLLACVSMMGDVGFALKENTIGFTSLEHTPELQTLAKHLGIINDKCVSQSHLVNLTYDLSFIAMELGCSFVRKIYHSGLKDKIKKKEFRQVVELIAKFIHRVLMVRYSQYVYLEDKVETLVGNGLFVEPTYRPADGVFTQEDYELFFSGFIKKQAHILFRSGFASLIENYSDRNVMVSEVITHYMKYLSEIEDPSVWHLQKGIICALSSGHVNFEYKNPAHSEVAAHCDVLFRADDVLISATSFFLSRLLYYVRYNESFYSDTGGMRAYNYRGYSFFKALSGEALGGCKVESNNFNKINAFDEFIGDLFCGCIIFLAFDIVPLAKEYITPYLSYHSVSIKKSKKKFKK